MSYAIDYLGRGDPNYPRRLACCLGERAPAVVTLRGNADIWFTRQDPLLALSCSEKAPASVILAIHDLAQAWRKEPPIIISGFHSPVEQEALAVLLRGPQPIILCPARGIARMRVRAEWKEPMAAGRLLLMSPFDEKVRRMTADTAQERNLFVAALADAVLVAHAEPKSKTERLAGGVLAWGKPVYTLDNATNGYLVAMGVERWEDARLGRGRRG